MGFPFTPYPIYGIIPNFASQTVTAKNLTTNETQTEIIETDTNYLIDCANFTSGYTNLDVIQISVTGRVYIISINEVQFPDGRQLDIVPQHYNNNRITQYN